MAYFAAIRRNQNLGTNSMATSAAEKAINDLRRDIENLTVQAEALKNEISHKTATLDGMCHVYGLLSPAEKQNGISDFSRKNRRMRLGAKKRVIYQLVAEGPARLDSIDARLINYGIDSRLVRDVVRVALSDGDMVGSIESHVAIAKQGEELIKKAKMPDDWEDYSIIFSNTAPTRDLAGAIKFAGGEPTPPDTEEDPSKEGIFQ
jgi:hypothetical protein